jgi:hypothetical protein
MCNHTKVLVCALVCGSTKKFGKSLNFEKIFRNGQKLSAKNERLFFIFVVFDNWQVWFLQNSILLRSSLWNGEKKTRVKN